MVSRLNPYIGFTDNARQAMEFYQEVFGGTLVVNTFGEYGTEGEDADKIMHGQLETDKGYTLMGADTLAGMERDSGSSITISLSGDEGDDLRGYWEKLAEGGTITASAGEADVGRRVRSMHRQVRRQLDDQHRSAAGLIGSAGHDERRWARGPIPGRRHADGRRCPGSRTRRRGET